MSTPAVGTLRVLSTDLIQAVRALRTAQRSGRQIFLSFDGAAFEISRGATSVRVPAHGQWSRIGITPPALVEEIWRRRGAFATEVVVMGLDSHVAFDNYSIKCTWSLALPANPASNDLGDRVASLRAASEQDVIDHLVEAVDAGDSDAKKSWGDLLLDGRAERAWRRARIAESGIILLTSEIEGENVDLAELLEALDADGVTQFRLKRIEAGAPLSPTEMAAWRRHLEQRFDPNDDPSYQNEWVLLEIKHSRRRGAAYVAVTGWKDDSGRFLAAYSTYSEALNALRQAGMVAITSDLAWGDRFRER